MQKVFPQTDRQTGWKKVAKSVPTDRQTGRQTDRVEKVAKNVPTDRQTDSRTDRQTDR